LTISSARPIRSNVSRLRACTTIARDWVVGVASLSMIRYIDGDLSPLRR
jgi:hypothetical protein